MWVCERGIGIEGAPTCKVSSHHVSRMRARARVRVRVRVRVRCLVFGVWSLVVRLREAFGV